MSPIQSAIRDNKHRGNIGEFLKNNINSGSELAIVSAYFTIYAYHSLKGDLDSISKLRFLFGEPTFIKSIDPSKVNKRDFQIEDDKLVIPIENRLTQKAVAKECAEWIKDKVEIKSMVKPSFLHGKMYHISQQNGVEKAILGSSNFTVNGLGLGSSPNIELNIVVDNDRDRTDLKDWFNELWNDTTGLVEDVKEDVLKYLDQLFLENEPEFIYFKTLYHVFEKFLEEQQKGGLLTSETGFFDSEIWNMLYKFQQDGVKGAINKILRHNGCIIADSVGLGKTYEALAVIRYFELLNYRVAVICPKKLSENWTVFQSGQGSSLSPFVKDKFNYTVLYHTDLGRKSGKSAANGINLGELNWGAYDLVVIDESHNFKGNPLEKTNDKGEVKKNRAKWLMDEIIKKGVQTKVLMLSATPVNNNLKDLRNQIALITEGRNDAMFETTGIKDISLALKNAQTQFTLWADSKKNPKRTVKQLIERLDSSFFKLLDEVTIARSRKHVINFYNAESEVGKFPVRLPAIPKYSNIDSQDRFFTYDKLNQKILEYKLSIFNPSAYVKPGLENKYGIKTAADKEEEKRKREEKKKKKNGGSDGGGELNFDQADRENFLIGMMKVNFLKRLESSVESFEISMKRTIEKIENLENVIADFKNKIAEKSPLNEDYTVEIEEQETEDDEDFDEFEIGKKLKFKLSDLDLDKWLADLKSDRTALGDLYDKACVITPERDAKLHDLKKLIGDKVTKPINSGNKKILIFTAFADTASYLYDCLKGWVVDDLKLNIALVAGSQTKTTFGDNNFQHILTHFSPISKNREKLINLPQKGEIDILIATDCISEGQNLQDCDYLINYDIHWNPVRIIQRFGRIDRLGSKNKEIQLVNFWPTKDLDNYINLKERVESRMALVDVTATADDNLLSSEQIEELIDEDLKYRHKQLKKLQDEVLDLEDMDEGVTLTDFSLDDFRSELLRFIESNRKRLEEAPFGLYAIVPAPSGVHSNLLPDDKYRPEEKDIIRPGVVFCLKQKGDTIGNEQVNPLQPYFLVYIRDDGQVRFNYVNAKHILEIYRLMCSGQSEAYNELCDLFNEETQQGADMAHYSGLLAQAAAEIARVFNKRSDQKIVGNDRGALLVPKTKRVSESNNFELVTWLIIK